MAEKIYKYEELRVYQNAFEMAMIIFELTKKFPSEEKYSMTDQMRRSSRSVCANVAEAWRKRRYKAAFIAKLSDAEGEANETQVWLDFSRACRYLEESNVSDLKYRYEIILRQIISMILHPEKWQL